MYLSPLEQLLGIYLLKICINFVTGYQYLTLMSGYEHHSNQVVLCTISVYFAMFMMCFLSVMTLTSLYKALRSNSN